MALAKKRAPPNFKSCSRVWRPPPKHPRHTFARRRRACTRSHRGGRPAQRVLAAPCSRLRLRSYPCARRPLCHDGQSCGATGILLVHCQRQALRSGRAAVPQGDIRGADFLVRHPVAPCRPLDWTGATTAPRRASACARRAGESRAAISVLLTVLLARLQCASCMELLQFPRPARLGQRHASGGTSSATMWPLLPIACNYIHY